MDDIMFTFAISLPIAKTVQIFATLIYTNFIMFLTIASNKLKCVDEKALRLRLCDRDQRALTG